ncbi:MAG: rubrerythrin family protein [Elusimicrobia bacterium]|nr:rubrerythrin family protein [Elusimicrobiota bacterium]MBU2614263.1 rubrerythrin family protein [Elusimicrobiota bacterium]
MKSIKGSKTEKNLLATFAGESQARNRYTYFASAAKKEGYEQISFLFTDTAENEKEHAKVFFKYLEGGDVEITATYPAGVIGKTTENLKEAAAGENLEYSKLYPEFAKIAEAEGYPEVAASYRAIVVAERQHEKRYLALLENIKNNRVFKREKITKWRCRNCGYIHEGAEAPKECPACKHPTAYFELLGENW